MHCKAKDPLQGIAAAVESPSLPPLQQTASWQSLHGGQIRIHPQPCIAFEISREMDGTDAMHAHMPQHHLNLTLTLASHSSHQDTIKHRSSSTSHQARTSLAFLGIIRTPKGAANTSPTRQEREDGFISHSRGRSSKFGAKAVAAIHGGLCNFFKQLRGQIWTCAVCIR